MWIKIQDQQPPKGTRVIGINCQPDNIDVPVIDGILYDIRINCLIDFNRGRWIEITHWAYHPDVTPKPSYGEPGFEFPPCSQCGSTSLRCGWD